MFLAVRVYMYRILTFPSPFFTQPYRRECSFAMFINTPDDDSIIRSKQEGFVMGVIKG